MKIAALYDEEKKTVLEEDALLDFPLQKMEFLTKSTVAVNIAAFVFKQ
jgi:hypothetical protein